jgi:hypothetical protein
MRNHPIRLHHKKIFPPTKNFTAKDLITRDQAISLVTDKLCKDPTEWRTTRDKGKKD